MPDGNMKVMLLAAGRGERLRPLTDTTPKPLLSIAGEPLIAHQLRWLKAAGLTDVVVNLFHLGSAIEARIGDGSQYGVRVRYSRETQRLETGGGIVQALPLLGDAPFVVLNGDIWTDFPFAQLPRQLTGGDLVHLVMTPTPSHRSAGDFNLVLPDTATGRDQAAPSLDRRPSSPPRKKSGRWSGSVSAPESEWTSASTSDAASERFEKHAGGHPVGRMVGRVRRTDPMRFTQCGISVLSPALFAGHDPARPQAFSLRDLWFSAANDDRVSGELWHGRWIDIGTPDQLDAVRQLAEPDRP